MSRKLDTSFEVSPSKDSISDSSGPVVSVSVALRVGLWTFSSSSSTSLALIGGPGGGGMTSKAYTYVTMCLLTSQEGIHVKLSIRVGFGYFFVRHFGVSNKLRILCAKK